MLPKKGWWWGRAFWPARLGNLRVQEGPFLHHLKCIHWAAPGTSQSLSFNLTVSLKVASGVQATCMSPRLGLPFTGCSRHGQYKGVRVERCLRLIYFYSIIISFSIWLWVSKKILKPQATRYLSCPSCPPPCPLPRICHPPHTPYPHILSAGGKGPASCLHHSHPHSHPYSHPSAAGWRPTAGSPFPPGPGLCVGPGWCPPCLVWGLERQSSEIFLCSSSHCINAHSPKGEDLTPGASQVVSGPPLLPLLP